MIEHVTIENFRCLKHVSVPLKPLTVLIGPNDSGKSSFLAALGYLASPAEKSDTLENRWKHQDSPTLSALWKGNRLPPDSFQRDANTVPSILRVILPPEGPMMGSKGANGVPRLDRVGQNVPALLDYLLRKHRARFDHFVESLRAHVPGLERVDIDTPSPELRTIELVTDGGFGFSASQASAGVRILIFFLALVHHPEPPDLLLIEEPENGLHPKRLSNVMRLLRSLTKGRFGAHEASQPTQVVLTTHSPYLLDEVDLKTDQVLVFRREPDGERTAEPVDGERLKLFLEDFNLGEVWFNQSEEGLVRRA